MTPKWLLAFPKNSVPTKWLLALGTEHSSGGEAPGRARGTLPPRCPRSPTSTGGRLLTSLDGRSALPPHPQTGCKSSIRSSRPDLEERKVPPHTRARMGVFWEKLNFPKPKESKREGSDQKRDPTPRKHERTCPQAVAPLSSWMSLQQPPGTRDI